MKQRWYLFGAAAVVVAMLALLLWLHRGGGQENYFLGGALHTAAAADDDERAVAALADETDVWARFGRPSARPALPLKYRAQDFLALGGDGGVSVVFQQPQDVVEAWLAVLTPAANLAGFSGGCGSVGLGTTPYPVAYSFFSDKTQKRMSLRHFVGSFAGVGALRPLRLLPAVSTGDRRCFFAEVEAIVVMADGRPTAFAYYYGLIAAEDCGEDGWKIASADWIGEDFLCAPAHGWAWDARALVEIIYGEWYGITGNVSQEEDDGIVRVYIAGATGYRFDFVRLTNGEDVLLHEFARDGNRWKETWILKPEHAIYKLTPSSPLLARPGG